MSRRNVPDVVDVIRSVDLGVLVPNVENGQLDECPIADMVEGYCGWLASSRTSQAGPPCPAVRERGAHRSRERAHAANGGADRAYGFRVARSLAPPGRALISHERRGVRERGTRCTGMAAPLVDLPMPRCT